MHKNKLNTLMILMLALCLLLPAAGAEDTFTVTFYEENSEDSTVLFTQEVAVGATAEEPDEPERAEYTFLGWFATPTYRFPFDFTMPITEDTAIFGRWQAPFTPDERHWYITGNTNGWDAADEETYAMTRAEDVNIFNVTIDLMAGSEFQINTGGTWDNQRGAGYLVEVVPDDAITGGGGLSDSTLKANMKAAVDGRYEVVFNSDLDEIRITRVGDLESGEETAITPTLTGTINNYQLPDDPSGSPFALSREDGLYVLDINLNAGDAFAVTRNNDWSVQYRTDQVDQAASDAPLGEGGGNITVTERGRYRIALDPDAETITVTSLGAYETPENEPAITFVNGDTENSITVAEGARIPRPDRPEAEGLSFIGWFDEDGAIFPFNERICEGDLRLEARFMSPDDIDTRSYHLYGTMTGWAMDDMTHTLDKAPDANVYTVTVELKAGDQFQLLEGAHTENQVSASRLVEGGYDPEKIGGSGNIDVKADGVYTITYDSFERTLRVETAE